ncbi:hypothetical protein SAY87_025126 [Trapa incisa]|uniref:Uncharacterized protein n=1 Tax=Trapa incisa TaxID=236973 RepID=A0AAN7GD64_9MYRT|nr:hypothetical protein SAY87_025126 [Trapa incisa]
MSELAQTYRSDKALSAAVEAKIRDPRIGRRFRRKASERGRTVDILPAVFPGYFHKVICNSAEFMNTTV